MALRNQQGRYWLATLPCSTGWEPSPAVLNDDIVCIFGQKERGENTNYEHWQFMIITKKLRLNRLKSYFPPQIHLELSRSKAAEDYVTKEETRIGEPFCYGTRFILHCI